MEVFGSAREEVLPLIHSSRGRGVEYFFVKLAQAFFPVIPAAAIGALVGGVGASVFDFDVKTTLEATAVGAVVLSLPLCAAFLGLNKINQSGRQFSRVEKTILQLGFLFALFAGGAALGATILSIEEPGTHAGLAAAGVVVTTLPVLAVAGAFWTASKLYGGFGLDVHLKL